MNLNFFKKVKEVTVEAVPSNSQKGELNTIDWAKIARDFAGGAGLTLLAYTIQYLSNVDLSNGAAWLPAAIPIAIMILQAIQKKYTSPKGQ